MRTHTLCSIVLAGIVATTGGAAAATAQAPEMSPQQLFESGR